MKKGFSLLEVLLSIVMLSLIVTVLFPIIGNLISSSARHKYSSEAANVLQNGAEAVYNIMLGTTDWDTVDNGTILHVQNVVDTSETFSWTLEPDKEIVRGRFNRWTQIDQVCRDADTGERIDCVDMTTLDPRSRMITTHVTWTEASGEKSLKTQLLVVKL